MPLGSMSTQVYRLEDRGTVGVGGETLARATRPGCRIELVVLEADECDQIGGRQKTLIDANGPRTGVGFRVVDGHIDFQRADCWPPVALGDLALGGQWGAVDVEPAAVAEVSALDDVRVALPSASLLSHPPQLHSRCRRTTVAVQ